LSKTDKPNKPNKLDKPKTPRAETATAASADSKTVKKNKIGKTGIAFPIFNLALSLIITGVVGFFGYKGWLQLEQQKNTAQTQQQQLQQLLQQQRTVSQQVEAQLQQNSLTQNNELNTIKETISAFLKQNQHTRRDWLIAEAEYLIKLANHRLVLAHDVSTSIQALRAADNRLLEVGNPKFIPLRKALAIDIQKLIAVPKFDIVGISLKLNALQLQIESLPLATPDPKTNEQRSKTESNISKADNWQQLPRAIWQDLLNLVDIQYHNEAIKPLLLPEQQFFLIQNLKLQLEQARLALLKDHHVIYKDRIKQAQKWISNYFDKKQTITQTVNQTLDELAATNTTQELPDISNSLTNLQILHPNNNYQLKKKSSINKAANSKLPSKKKIASKKKKKVSKPAVAKSKTKSIKDSNPEIKKPVETPAKEKQKEPVLITPNKQTNTPTEVPATKI